MTLPDALDAGFVFLGTGAIKGSAILLVAAVVARLTRGKSAATRRLIWSMAIASLIMLPALEHALPEATLIRAEVSLPRVDSETRAPSLVGLFDTSPPRIPSGASRVTSDVSPFESQALSGLPGKRSGTIELLNARGVTRTVVLLWIVGIMVVLTLIGLSWIRLLLLVRKATTVTDKSLLDVLHRSARLLGVERYVWLSISHHAVVPMAWGIFRPSIVLPHSATTWSRDRLESVLLHELAHIRNADPIGRLVAALACALHWYNPLAWLAARRFEVEGEQYCDDLVVLAGRPPVSYASDLLELARGLQGHRRLTATVGLFGESALSARIRAILASSRQRSLPTRRTLVVVRLSALAFVLTVASLRPVAMRDATATPARLTDHVSGIPENTLDAVVQPTPPQSDVTETSVTSDRPVPVLPDEVLADAAGSVNSQAAAAILRIDGPTASVPHVAPVNRQPVSSSPLDYRTILALSTDEMVLWLRTDEVADTRRRMAWGLHTRGRSVAAALALALRSDTDAAVREMAAWALGETRGGQASDLAFAVRNDSDAEVRSSAFWALEQEGRPAATSALGSAMRDAHTPLRRRALWYAGFHGVRDRAPDLVEALSHSDAESRRTAAWSLGTLRAQQDSRSLIPLLYDSNPGVRQAAAWALHRLDTPDSRAAMSAASASSAEVQHIFARVERTGQPVDWSWSWTMPRPRTRP